MFDQCQPNGVAAIHYTPTENIDLSQFSNDQRPVEWGGLAPSQSGSLRDFAWEIRGGDIIVVAKSYPPLIVGYGRVHGSELKTAYRFDAQTPIVDEEGTHWKHLIDVAWEPIPAGKEISYPDPSASQYSVLELTGEELKRVKALIKSLPSSPGSEQGIHNAGLEANIRLRELEDSSYTRYTPEALKTIDRKHVELCNAFTKWLQQEKGFTCIVERRNIDATFSIGPRKVLVEFKVAYNSRTKPAIREALGQILEYNHYGDRTTHDDWILVLDCEPNKGDKEFISAIRQYGLPLSLGWATADGFRFSESCDYL